MDLLHSLGHLRDSRDRVYAAWRWNYERKERDGKEIANKSQTTRLLRVMLMTPPASCAYPSRKTRKFRPARHGGIVPLFTGLCPVTHTSLTQLQEIKHSPSTFSLYVLNERVTAQKNPKVNRPDTIVNSRTHSPDESAQRKIISRLFKRIRVHFLPLSIVQSPARRGILFTRSSCARIQRAKARVRSSRRAITNS